MKADLKVFLRGPLLVAARHLHDEQRELGANVCRQRIESMKKQREKYLTDLRLIAVAMTNRVFEHLKEEKDRERRDVRGRSVLLQRGERDLPRMPVDEKAIQLLVQVLLSHEIRARIVVIRQRSIQLVHSIYKREESTDRSLLDALSLLYSSSSRIYMYSSLFLSLTRCFSPMLTFERDGELGVEKCLRIVRVLIISVD